MFTPGLFTRRRGASGQIGPVIRSTGYLQGGYKDSTKKSIIQKYNTTTETGALVFDTGFVRSYVPGITGADSGYFGSSDANTLHYKFSYVTNTMKSSYTTSNFDSVTVFDVGSNTQAWVGCSTAATGGVALASMYKLATATDTSTTKTVIAGSVGTTRQALSMPTCAAFCDSSVLRTLTFATEAVVASGSYSALASMTYGCGLSQSSTIGHLVNTSVNAKITYSGSTVSAVAADTAFSYQFNESHSISSDIAGYMLAGYADTTGRYGSTQHGLAQKYKFATSAISTLADVVTPQSSGQMMAGY